MKKLLLVLTLFVLTFSCSSDSDGVSINQDLVGEWSGDIGDNPDSELELHLYDDGKGDMYIYNSSGGIVDSDYFTWSATSSKITLNYLSTTDADGNVSYDDNGNLIEVVYDSETFDYELNSAGDVGVFTDGEGVMFTLYLQE